MGRVRRFEGLVEAYGRLAAAAVTRVLGPRREQREDIQQDVMLALWKRLSREQDIEAPASYLYKMAVREAVRAVARGRRRAESSLDEAPASSVAAPPLAEDLVRQQEQARALRTAIEGLQPDRARAVRGYLAGLSVDEMMHLYGWSYQRARNLVARGIADLKAAMRQGEGM